MKACHPPGTWHLGVLSASPGRGDPCRAFNREEHLLARQAPALSPMQDPLQGTPCSLAVTVSPHSQSTWQLRHYQKIFSQNSPPQKRRCHLVSGRPARRP